MDSNHTKIEKETLSVIVLETWNIWLDVAKKCKIENNDLSSWYKDTVWNVLSKCKELPLASFVKSNGSSISDFDYSFEFELKILDKHDRNKFNYFAEFQNPKKSVLEFEIEWGKIICEVDSMAKQQLDQTISMISPRLLNKDEDHERRHDEHELNHNFDDSASSEDLFVDDSSFIVIANKEEKVNSNKIASKNISDEINAKVKHRIMENKKLVDDGEDDYQFSHEQLFGK